MTQATGCISIAVQAASDIRVDRVIEYFDPHPDQRTIWVDLFVHNPNLEQHPLWILHRGSLEAADATDSWLLDSNDDPYASSLTRRITKLHAPLAHPSDPQIDRIEILDDSSVIVGDEHYSLWPKPRRLERQLGDDLDIDSPYTLWEIRNFGTHVRTLARLKLTLRPHSYSSQVGNPESFLAYGEAILLDFIKNFDLPRMLNEYPDRADAYVRQFEYFTKDARHLVPKVFEYLIVSPDHRTLDWYAEPLSYVDRPLVRDTEIVRHAEWFLADLSKAAQFSIVSRPFNDLTLRIVTRAQHLPDLVPQR
jgi:hypothetical protein